MVAAAASAAVRTQHTAQGAVLKYMELAERQVSVGNNDPWLKLKAQTAIQILRAASAGKRLFIFNNVCGIGARLQPVWLDHASQLG